MSAPAVVVLCGLCLVGGLVIVLVGFGLIIRAVVGTTMAVSSAVDGYVKFKENK